MQGKSLSNNKSLRVALLYQFHSLRMKMAISVASQLDTNDNNLHITDTVLSLENSLSFAVTSIEQQQQQQQQQHKQPVNDDSNSSNNLKTKLKSIIEDSISNLRYCRKLDPADFKSVYRLALSYHHMSSISFLNTSPEGTLNPGEEELQVSTQSQTQTQRSALDEIYKLFDRKRSQIVAIWCLESASNRFEQINQRTFKFDSFRVKVLKFFTL